MASTNSQPHISRQQFNALLASHRAFHEVAIKVTDILLDPSRSARYQSLSSTYDDEVDVNYLTYGPHGLKGDAVAPSAKPPDPSQYERMPSRIEPSARTNFQIENVRARKAYRQKRQRSHEMYARAFGSYLAADYDFQCTCTFMTLLWN